MSRVAASLLFGALVVIGCGSSSGSPDAGSTDAGSTSVSPESRCAGFILADISLWLETKPCNPDAGLGFNGTGSASALVASCSAVLSSSACSAMDVDNLEVYTSCASDIPACTPSDDGAAFNAAVQACRAAASSDGGAAISATCYSALMAALAASSNGDQ
jgi:hypothetical protein